MPRIRTHKPEFWSHPVMGRQDDATKCLALALMNFADDEGYFYADPAVIRAFARPFDDESTTTRRALEHLSKTGFILVVEHPVRGPIGRMPDFDKHQRIDRPKASEIKHFWGECDSTNDPGMIDDESTLEGKGKEGKGRDVPPTPLEGEKPKRRTRGQIIEPYSEDVRFVANAVLKKGFWHTQDPDGRLINQDPAQLCIQLDLIFRENPSLSRDLLVQAARSYLDKPRKSYSAAQWFFGRGTNEKPAHWFVEVRMLQHQAARKAEGQQAPLNLESQKEA